MTNEETIRHLMQVAHAWAAEEDHPDHGRSDTLEIELRKAFTAMTPRASVEEAIRAAMNCAYEAAAIQCELETRKTMALDGSTFYIAAGQCARAIRALKNDTPIAGVKASLPCCPPGEPHAFDCPNGVNGPLAADAYWKGFADGEKHAADVAADGVTAAHAPSDEGCTVHHLAHPCEACAAELPFRQFLEHWTHESHLQTFEDRERFRKAALDLLGEWPAPDGVNPSDGTQPKGGA